MALQGSGAQSRPLNTPAAENSTPPMYALLRSNVTLLRLSCDACVYAAVWMAPPSCAVLPRNTLSTSCSCVAPERAMATVPMQSPWPTLLMNVQRVTLMALVSSPK